MGTTRSKAAARSLRPAVLFGSLGVVAMVGCAMTPTVASCPRGEQRHEGQCIPTSSLVFERCLESFRKTKVEREHGVDTEVTAEVKGQGGSFRRERKDTEAAEYDGLPPALMGEAISECRRQEEIQRGLELERAWAAADESQRRTELALAERGEAERALRRAEQQRDHHLHAQEVLQAELDATRGELGELREQQEQERERIALQHPCTVAAWDRCADQALTAKQAGQFDRAHRLYRQACEGGSATACSNWAVMFEQGVGVEPQPERAGELYARACTEGDANACVNLGFLYEHGRGVSMSRTRAAELYELGCEDDNMRGCGRLGLLLDNSRGTRLVADACEEGYFRACVWEGQWHLDGRYGEREADTAARRFGTACEADVAEGCLQLGRLHELGDGVEQELGRAQALYGRACDGGDARGCTAAERVARGSVLEHNTESPVSG